MVRHYKKVQWRHGRWLCGTGREQFYAVLLLLANTPPTDLEAVMQLLQRPEAAVPLTVLVVGNGTEGYGPLQVRRVSPHGKQMVG